MIFMDFINPYPQILMRTNVVHPNKNFLPGKFLFIHSANVGEVLKLW